MAGRRWRLVTWTRAPGLEVGARPRGNMHDPVNAGVGGGDRAPGWHGVVLVTWEGAQKALSLEVHRCSWVPTRAGTLDGNNRKHNDHGANFLAPALARCGLEEGRLVPRPMASSAGPSSWRPRSGKRLRPGRTPVSLPQVKSSKKRPTE